ncbi:PepSY domain-containing protein [Azospirillum sp. TSO22-1]|uniref:PepSY domain-containing protein n=1 Tax=Azospirillum sp. TSO22-1 TaxID=716789 RepID=UPI0018EEB4C8|nr:PepSY domain-containing protein [Azospirillum sp. TSO22-1]
MRFGFLAAALLAAGLATAAAHAQQTSQTAAADILSVRAVLDKVEAQGYRDITEVEREDGRYEVKATDADGRRVKIHVDGRTGEIVKTERK